MEQKKMVEVVAGIIWEGHRFLCAQRIKGTHKGEWEFPGGKVDQGEPLEQALQREILEELDIVVTKSKLWRSIDHDYGDKIVRLHVFNVYAYTGSIRSVEGPAHKWVTISEAMELKFLPADQPLLPFLKP